MSKAVIGFLGAGGIAKSHAFALSALKFYYTDTPEIALEAVTSLREESRLRFAEIYGFKKAPDPEAFFKSDNLDTVFILGPNKVHYPHLETVLKLPALKRVYLEKPVCSSLDEENKMANIQNHYAHIKFQVGFQLLQMSAIRKALMMWNSGIFGKPIHFNFKLQHCDYLQKSYRDKRTSRLTPAPDGGAMADLGSHAISLAVAFLGQKLEILNAVQAGNFEDVPVASDLYSEISVIDKDSKAVGTISGSRISAGLGDLLAFEIFAEKGAIRFSSAEPDILEYFLNSQDNWTKSSTGSNFMPASGFPSVHVSGGWLRSLFHAHYLFLIDEPSEDFIPDLNHGLTVQRLVRETAERLNMFRSAIL